MKKSRYTEEQIAYAMKQAEAGAPVAEVIRRMGISKPGLATLCAASQRTAPSI